MSNLTVYVSSPSSSMRLYSFAVAVETRTSLWAQALEAVLDKIWSDPAKIAIHEILSVVKALRGSKEEVSKAYNAASISAKDAELNPVLDPPRIPTSDAGTQTPCWWEMSAPVRHVAKDRGSSHNHLDRKMAAGPPTMMQRKAQTARTRKMKTRPVGILIDVGSETDFLTVAKQIKGGMDQKTMGNKITGNRRTKNGGLLIEVRGDQAAVNTSVKSDVADSIQRQTLIPEDTIKVVSLRSTFGGSQTALGLLPMVKAKEIIAEGRIKISVVNCRVRLPDKKRIRCFRCLAFDHEAKECKGADRSKCCRRCEDVGHFAKDYKKDALKAATFAKTLREESKSKSKTAATVATTGTERTVEATEKQSAK
ncbi:hypothetical protein QTP88_014871 [Uroleucon formosanum]